MHFIGEVSINLSLFVYFIWFLPQIRVNFKRRSTEGLSMFMHGLLCIGYIADLMYGFGRHMPWQYRMVTCSGLASLAVQHYQFGRFGLHKNTEKISYIFISVACLILLGYAFYNLDLTRRSKNFYDIAGVISNASWFCYVIPQIIKNYKNKSVEGLSLSFVLFSIILSVCDAVSAWTLGWDYPSKIGAPLTLIKKSVLLMQMKYYKNKQPRQVLAAC